MAWQRNLAKTTAILEIYNIETIKIKEKINTKTHIHIETSKQNMIEIVTKPKVG